MVNLTQEANKIRLDHTRLLYCQYLIKGELIRAVDDLFLDEIKKLTELTKEEHVRANC